MFAILKKIQDSSPEKFDHWVNPGKGSPSAVGMLRLIGSESGWLTAIVTVVFLMVTQAFIIFGIVFLVV